MKLRALIVDDSRVMRNMVIQSLERAKLASFEFTQAEDGLDALDKYDPEMIDIIFADINMPNMDGIDFVTKVRQMKNGSEIPIIMITSEKTVGKMEAALDVAGANTYICKPFTVDELRWKVGKLIGK